MTTHQVSQWLSLSPHSGLCWNVLPWESFLDQRSTSPPNPDHFLFPSLALFFLLVFSLLGMTCICLFRIWNPLGYVVPGGQQLRLSCFLLYLQCLGQCLELRKCLLYWRINKGGNEVADMENSASTTLLGVQSRFMLQLVLSAKDSA